MRLVFYKLLRKIMAIMSTDQTLLENTAAPAIVSAADFQSFDFQKIIENIQHIDCHSLEKIFENAAKDSEKEDNKQRFQVYRMLAVLCCFHFKPEDHATPYGPMFVMDGKRAPIPEDLSSDQNRALAQIVHTIKHPGLRARIADIVWYNNRKEKEAGVAAINAYCECIVGIQEGKFKCRFETENNPSQEEVQFLQRTLQIAARISKKDQLPEIVRNTTFLLYEAAKNNKACISFSNIAELALRADLIDPKIVGKDAENLAEAVSDPDAYPMAVKAVLNTAAKAYKKANDTEGEKRSQLKSVEQTLLMRRHVSTASAEASWIRDAIEELRVIQGTKQRQENLRLEMRELQEKARDEVGTFSIPLDLKDEQTGTIKIFESLTLPDALLEFARLSKSPTLEELKQEALASISNSPLLAMMSSSYFDNEGKIVAEAPGASADGNPSEEWLKKAMSENAKFGRHVVVGALIEPARTTLEANYSITNRHFNVIVDNSPFIPDSHRYTFALGFARLIQGDFVSAAHLLIPQVENSIRHVLRSCQPDFSKIMPDMLQEDRSLSDLLDKFRTELNQIFSPAIINEIDLLFSYRPGPALRHEFAHGKIPSGYCFSPDIIYACWFIYRLTCVPLFSHWKEHIAPAIEAECF